VSLVKAYVTPPVLLTAFPKGSLLLATAIPRTIFVGTLRRPALLIRAALGLPCCFCESRADQQTGMPHIVSTHWRPDEPDFCLFLTRTQTSQRAGFRRKPQPPCFAPHQHRATTCRRPLHRPDCLAGKLCSLRTNCARSSQEHHLRCVDCARRVSPHVRLSYKLDIDPDTHDHNNRCDSRKNGAIQEESGLTMAVYNTMYNCH
jgi:hypothetical protein